MNSNTGGFSSTLNTSLKPELPKIVEHINEKVFVFHQILDEVESWSLKVL
jgi:hypothetical protein